MGMKEVLERELELISVSSEEEKKIKERADEIIKRFSGEGLKAEIGGSLAKGTLIKKDIQDIDIFVVFDKEEAIKRLEEAIKRLKLKADKVHGSRDYFRIREGAVVFELIPVVKLKKGDTERSGQKQRESLVKETEKVSISRNVTDFSLSHVKYVVKMLKKNKKLKDEIKLAKSFCHANEVYGAESYINGFSGYALELLIIYFGSFEKFLKGIEKKRAIDTEILDKSSKFLSQKISKQANQKFFDIEKKFKNEAEIKKEINKSKLGSPIVLIDPTFKYRNVTACLSEETFKKFLEAGKEFLRIPTLESFKKKEIDLNALKKLAKDNDARTISFSFSTDKQEGDIAGTKMKKFSEFISRELERKEQKVLRKEFEYNGGKSAFAYFIVKEKKEIEVKGPPVANKQACEAFKKARRKVFVKGKDLWTREKVDLRTLLQTLRNFEEEMSVRMNFSIS